MRVPSPSSCFFVTFAIFLTSTKSYALAPTHNLSPIIGQLPKVRFAATGERSYKARYSINLTTANYFSAGTDGELNYFVDGETNAFEQAFEWQHESWSIGFAHTFLSHSKGVLDDPIYEFHDLFGFPQNGRTKQTNDQFRWQIENGTETLYSASSNKSGMGDSRLYIDKVLDDGKLVLRADLSLPTGSIPSRTGTETWGLSLSASQEGPMLFASAAYLPTLATWYSAGATLLKSKSLLDEIDLHPVVIAGAAGSEWQATQRFSIDMQVALNSPYFDSGIRELGWVPIIFTLSGAYRFGANQNSEFEFGFSEDLRPSTSPDFSVFLAYGYHFQ